VDPYLPGHAVGVVEAVVLEAHAVGDHASASLLAGERHARNSSTLSTTAGQPGVPIDRVGRGKEILRVIAWSTPRRVSPLQADGVSRAHAPYATVAMVTKGNEPTSRKRAIKSGGMPALSPTSPKVARLNFAGEGGPERKRRADRLDNFL